MKVLFIGNSHTYVHDMPLIFKEKASKLGIDCHVTMIAHPGWTLEKHNQNPEVKFNILYGDYDYVVCQEYAHPFGPVENLYTGMRILKSYIDQTKAKMIIFPTWAAKYNPEAQDVMSKAHKNIANELGVALAPVDTRWVDIQRNRKDTELYGGDGEHPSIDGSNLIAQAILDTILEFEK